MAVSLLTKQEISEQLENCPGWQVNETVLEKNYVFPDFSSALDFVNKLGAIAKELNHHPDIQLSWGKVFVSLTTHEVAGLTEYDFTFARRVDKNPTRKTVKYKVPNGKLLIIKATLQDDILRGVTLAGDFFVMPSDALPKLEDALEGFSLSDIAQLEEVLDYVISRENIRISGFSSGDLVKTVMKFKEES